MKVRILLAEGFALYRKNLKSRLSENPDCEVCGEAENGDDVVLLARALHPDVIVLDLALPGLAGFEAGRQILCEHDRTHIFLYSLFGADRLEEAAARAGFSGVFTKGEEAKLFRAIEELRLPPLRSPAAEACAPTPPVI